MMLIMYFKMEFVMRRLRIVQIKTKILVSVVQQGFTFNPIDVNAKNVLKKLQIVKNVLIGVNVQNVIKLPSNLLLKVTFAT